jgi:hypothetical protein
MVDEETVAQAVPCGPNPEPVLEQVRTYLEAGFDHVYFHQVGPDQKGFIEFATGELLPRLGEQRQSAA